MQGRYCKTVVLSIALMASSAWADEGRIDFSGAIRVPTCEAGSAVMTVGNGMPDRSFTCAGRGQATAADPSAYWISVAHLDGAAAAGNPLLQYFVDYHAPADVAGVGVVTRVYE